MVELHGVERHVPIVPLQLHQWHHLTVLEVVQQQMPALGGRGEHQGAHRRPLDGEEVARRWLDRVDWLALQNIGPFFNAVVI